MNVESGSSILPTPPANTTSAMEQSGMVEFSGLDFNTPFEHTNVTPLSGYGSVSMNDAFLDLDWDSLLTNLDWPESVVSANNATTTASDFTDTSSIPKETAWNFTEGLQLRQIDSVEAKCIEIQSYIGAFQTGIDHTILSKYLTRDRLVDCVQLYAKCFQSIHPILHLPTFELTKTPPDLLAAMMLVGACYSSNVIPPAIIVQGAIHMLLVLECSTVSASQWLFRYLNADRFLLARESNERSPISIYTGHCSIMSAPHFDPEPSSLLFCYNAQSSHHLSTSNANVLFS